MEELARPISIGIDENGSFEDLLKAMIIVNQTYTELGGDHLVIKRASSGDNAKDIMFMINSSPPKLTSESYREHIYSVLQKHLRPEYIPRIFVEMNKRFPQREWGNTFPLIETINLILSNPEACRRVDEYQLNLQDKRITS